ncbi:MAG: hypothetical protein KF878_10655 [Planctomycetes bacterium]|nr:hypothetical protein [Planctomycetota bacterium]
MRRLVVVLAASVALAACAPTVRLDEVALQRAGPRTLAVLPFEVVLAPGDRDADGQLARRADAVRAAVTRRLQLLSYRTLDPDVVDEALARAGLTPHAHRASYQALAAALGVDAVVRGRVTSLQNIEGAVLFVHTIAGDVRLVDLARGEVLCEVEHTERAIGGFLPESTQAVRAIVTTVENSTVPGFLRLAERFAEGVVRALPPPPTPPRRGAGGLDAVVVEAPAGSLAPGDLVTVEVRGAPGLDAAVDLGPDLRGVPLPEVAPGVYRGTHRVGVGEVGTGRPAARLRDRFGEGAWALADEPLVLAGRGPLAPRAGARRGRSMAWRAAQGAVGYRVYALDARGRPTLVAETTDLFAAVPADAPRVAVAAVDARGQVGPLVEAGP